MASKITETFMNALQTIEESGDVQPLVDLFTDDAVLNNLTEKEPRHGREGAEEFWRAYLASFDEIHSEFTNVIEGEGSATMEWISRGELENGEPIEYRGVSIIDVDNDKVRGFRTYYDSAAFVAGPGKKQNERDIEATRTPE